jgi:two-component system, NarL family, nitrate/nitrite response regulator NarL
MATGMGNDIRRLATYLTPRERECLAMLVDGLDTEAMSRRLGISSATIRSHVQSMLTKLNVHSRGEAATLAVRHRLLPHTDGRSAGPRGPRVAELPRTAS